MSGGPIPLLTEPGLVPFLCLASSSLQHSQLADSYASLRLGWMFLLQVPVLAPPPTLDPYELKILYFSFLTLICMAICVTSWSSAGL